MSGSIWLFFLLEVVLMGALSARGGSAAVVTPRNGSECRRWGLYEVALRLEPDDVHWLRTRNVQPLSATVVQARVTPPYPGKSVQVQGFYDGVGALKLRVYCQHPGQYRLITQSILERLHNLQYHFIVSTQGASGAVGKLRHHKGDPHQFVTDSGKWFLHIGDTGYRFLIPSEPMWRQYIDDAAIVQRATKVRAWLASGRHAVTEAVNAKQGLINPAFWDVVEARLWYALTKYPWVQVQVIVFGEDASAIASASTQPSSIWAYLPVYAQARLSSFANVHWCVINDVNTAAHVHAIASAMHSREPWGTLVTSHQRRGTGYTFATAPWSGIVTLQTLDASDGVDVQLYRRRQPYPVVLDEDRYETYKAPTGVAVADWFRMHFWSALVSGGHATYGGIQTWLPFSTGSATTGVRGYKALVSSKVLKGGARDLRHMHSFFEIGPVKSMVGFVPGTPSVCGGVPAAVLCAFRSPWALFYLKQRRTGLPIVNVTLGQRGGRRFQLHVFDPVQVKFQASRQVGLAPGANHVSLHCQAPIVTDCVIVVHALDSVFL
jgi:hypothetical protein